MLECPAWVDRQSLEPGGGSDRIWVKEPVANANHSRTDQSRVYHEGEIFVQSQTGVRDEAENLSGTIARGLTGTIASFLRAQRFAVCAGSKLSGQQVWASPLFGDQGFLEALAPRLLRISLMARGGDPLFEEPQTGAFSLALLLIDFGTRRRYRINGQAAWETETDLVLKTEEVYSNCPKYIQRRHLAGAAQVAETEIPPSVSANTLSPAQIKRIEQTDTFFIASYHPERGADVSHRGGLPGFVGVRTVPDGVQQIYFSDRAGNKMFNTFGNLTVNPRAGLMFYDFSNGDVLQLTGTSQIEGLDSSQRSICITLDGVVDRPNLSPLRWELVAYSPFC